LYFIYLWNVAPLLTGVLGISFCVLPAIVDRKSNLRAAMSTTTGIAPVYFELSWSILSTIGIANVLFGSLVCSITNFSQISAVPIVTSIAGAIANGLCFYAFYAEGGTLTSKAVASVFADLLWLVCATPKPPT
jgi:hypothetical protein